MEHVKEPEYEERPFMGFCEDLTLEILLRLPVKSLGRFKCVSKTWNSLISDPKFAKAHLQVSKLTTNNPPLALAKQKSNIISLLKLRSCTNIDEGVELIPLDQAFVGSDTYCGGSRFIIGSCDGLVCVYTKIRMKVGKDFMHLWNPTTNKYKRISLPEEYCFTYVYVESCWFGFIPSLDDYRIFLSCRSDKPFAERMFVYSLKNPKWREIHAPDKKMYFASGFPSVFANEALHCLVDNQWIHRFDLVAETFERVPLSIELDQFPKLTWKVIGVTGEKKSLCTMLIHYSTEYQWSHELWMLDEYNKWDSWKKMYRINLKDEVFQYYFNFIGFSFGGNLRIQRESGSELRLIDPSRDPPSYVVCQGIIYEVVDFVESLISPLSLN